MAALGRYLDAELVEQLDRLRPTVRRGVDGLAPGAHRSLIQGASLSFRQHRAYCHGDEPRRLDWRVLARTDRLFIKQYDHDTNLRVMIAVDASGSMGYGPAGTVAKFSFAAKVATALAYLLLRHGEAVGLTILGTAPAELWLPPAVGSNQLSLIVDRLDGAVCRGVIDLAASLDRMGSRLKRRSLLIVLSDFFTPPGPLGRGLAHLSHSGHQPLCLRVLHSDESRFPFQGFTRLRSLEGAQSRVVEPAAVRSAYLNRFNRHSESLSRACAAGRSIALSAHTHDPAIHVIERLLHHPKPGQR